MSHLTTPIAVEKPRNRFWINANFRLFSWQVHCMLMWTSLVALSSLVAGLPMLDIDLGMLSADQGFKVTGITGSPASDFTSRSVSTAGDVNGDGIDDIIFAEPFAQAPNIASGTRIGAGITYVVFGTRSWTDVSITFIAQNNLLGFRIFGAASYDYCGFAVGSAGDVNNDGIGDIIVASRFADPPAIGGTARTDAGITYVIFGRKVGGGVANFADIDLYTFVSSSALGFRILGATASNLAFSAAGTGDINGDGVADIIIGSPVSSAGSKFGAGVVFVVFGREVAQGAPSFADVDLSTFNSATPSGFRILGALARDETGVSVSGAGDVNNDGIDDIVVGGYTAGDSTRPGTASVVFGRRIPSGSTYLPDVDLSSLVGTTSTLGFYMLGTSNLDWSGYSVSGAGDINGDNIADIIVGSRVGDPPNIGSTARANAGITNVIFGRNVAATGQPFGSLNLATYITGTSTGFRIFGASASDQSGISVSMAGDLNRDGICDLIIGARDATVAGNVYAGMTYVIFGRNVFGGATPFTDIDLASFASDTTIGYRVLGHIASAYSGFAVSGAGDVNGDGAHDVLVSATNIGTVYVLYGTLNAPTSQPSSQPSGHPSTQPSMQPSRQPTAQPSSQPSHQPSGRPSSQPTGRPSAQPSNQPSSRPTGQPTTQPTGVPTRQPLVQPSTLPTSTPSSQPTSIPSSQPSHQPIAIPSALPSCQPSLQPSTQPSSQPSASPSVQPTVSPTSQPSSSPSRCPSAQPSNQPSVRPSLRPTTQPTAAPSVTPSTDPTAIPSARPTLQPSALPTSQPSSRPTVQPSRRPSGTPSGQPSTQPSSVPSAVPTACSTAIPSAWPSIQPSSRPSSKPSSQPSMQPSSMPSTVPSVRPSGQPSHAPTSQPTAPPSVLPTTLPSARPSALPSTQPTRQPSASPSSRPSISPRSQPTCRPTTHPSLQPQAQPTSQPTGVPTARPSHYSTGEWMYVNDATDVESSKIFLVAGQVWLCVGTGQQSCMLVSITTAAGLSQQSIPWSSVGSVVGTSTPDRVVLSGGGSEVAICVLVSVQYVCSGTHLSDTLIRTASYVAYPQKTVHIGMYNVHTSAIILDTRSGALQSYMYTATNLRILNITHAQSPALFIGCFVAGYSVSKAGTAATSIVAGWIRTDNGAMIAMNMYPRDGVLLNTADLVNVMALEDTGPDSFIAGGLELSDSADMNAYVLRVNALYNTVRYCVRFRSDYASGRRLSDDRTVTTRSVARGLLFTSSGLFCVMDVTRAGTVSATILYIDPATTAILNQVHVIAQGGNISCTNAIAAEYLLVLSCTVLRTFEPTQRLLLAVDHKLSLQPLPHGLQKSYNATFYSDSIPFQRSVLAVTKTVTTPAVSTYEFTTAAQSPTILPSVAPTLQPSSQPSSVPSTQPSSSPTAQPSVSMQPTSSPSPAAPTNTPKPSAVPSVVPTMHPSCVPTHAPTRTPSRRPTPLPTTQPSARPTPLATVDPTARPTRLPSTQPTIIATVRETAAPTQSPSLDVPDESTPRSTNNGRGSQTVVGASIAGGVVFLIIGFALYKYTKHKSDVKDRERRFKEYMARETAAAESARQHHEAEARRAEERKAEAAEERRIRKLMRSGRGAHGFSEPMRVLDTRHHAPRVPSQTSSSSVQVSSLHSSEQSSFYSREAYSESVSEECSSAGLSEDHDDVDNSTTGSYNGREYIGDDSAMEQGSAYHSKNSVEEDSYSSEYSVYFDDENDDV